MSNKQAELKVVYPGSFNPFHNGHFIVLEEALSIYPKITILVANNANKKGQIDLKVRRDLINKVLEEKQLTNSVDVVILEKNMKTTEYLAKNNVTLIIRGMRNFEKIFPIEATKEENLIFNNYLEDLPELNINYIVTDLDLSSSLIKQAIFNYDQKFLEENLPKSILKDVIKTWNMKI